MSDYGMGYGGVEETYPSNGPTIELDVNDPRTGTVRASKARLHAAMDDGAGRDMDSGSLHRRYPDH